MHFDIFDLDIYSKIISFFFDKREKIGSFVGIFLTIIYILSSLALLGYYINIILQREQMNVYDSRVYSHDIPIIEVNPNLIYFAFGLEDQGLQTDLLMKQYTIRLYYFLIELK